MGMGFAAVHTPKAYVTVTQPAQNFIIDLGRDQLKLEPNWMRQVKEPILARWDNKVLTDKGVFIVRDEQSLVKKSATPVKDHLLFK